MSESKRTRRCDRDVATDKLEAAAEVLTRINKDTLSQGLAFLGEQPETWRIPSGEHLPGSYVRFSEQPGPYGKLSEGELVVVEEHQRGELIVRNGNGVLLVAAAKALEESPDPQPD